MLDEFKFEKQKVSTGIQIAYRIGGEGQPLLLLHGYPQTHLMWAKIAHRLAEKFTVVMSDLRGYGDSDKPESDPRHETYSFRAMAEDQVSLMASLGYGQFAVAGHDRGARIVARAFRDAGFEVVYTGLHQSPEEIVQAAIQEDVDMIGLSSLAGAHMYLFTKVAELLHEHDADDIVVCGGGIIPEDDVAKLKKTGIKEIFPPGSTLSDIVQWVEKNIQPRA